jgi:hypothetical protein
MDLEKIIFIVLALLFSIFSMFMKSKKQKRTLPENERTDKDFSYESASFSILNQDAFLKSANIANLQENSNIYPKKSKKKQKLSNIEQESSHMENSKTILQNVDSETEIGLLEDFKGSELQKAFLFSEIFKNAKN